MWTPSEGADTYLVSTRRVTEDGFEEIRHQPPIDASSLEVNNDGNLEYFLGDPTPTAQSGLFYWDVTAWQGDAFQIGWDPGDPLNRNYGEYSVGAEALVWALAHPPGFDRGDDSLCPFPCPTTRINPQVRTGGEPVTTVLFYTGSNTEGVLWWIGASGEMPDDGDFNLAIVDPEGDGTVFLAEGVDVSADDLHLVAIPVSTVFSNGVTGFGPVLDVPVVISHCGGAGEQCCLNDDTDCSEPGDVCSFGVCQEPCGEAGQACCLDDKCLGFPCENGLCPNCGTEGRPCCATSDPNSDGCLRDTFCYVDNHCRRCGDDNTPCCSDGTCPHSASGYGCHNGTCEPARPPGATNVPGVGRACNQTVVVGANDGGHFSVDVDATSGNTWFTVRTLTVPDSVTLTYEGNVMAETGCVGTDLLANDCTDEILPWCCDNGSCGKRIPFSGSTSIFLVDVVPNCGGTSNTEWGFELECAN